VGVRGYIGMVDLAPGHLAAMSHTGGAVIPVGIYPDVWVGIYPDVSAYRSRPPMSE